MRKEKRTVEKETVRAQKRDRRFRIVDLVAFIACFAIALSVWIYVIGTENEEYEYTFTDVVVKYYGVTQLQNEHGLSIISENETKVNITVKGFRSEIMKYSSEDFSAYVDVDTISEVGMHSLGVMTELPEGKMSMVSTSPAAINVLVDETLSKSVPLKVNVRYDIADNLKLHDPIPEFDMLEIVGPESRIKDVAYAEVSYDLGSVTTSTNFKGAITLYDEVGNEIRNPYIKPAVSEVMVKIKVTTEKSVPIVAVFSAQDTAEYEYKVIFVPETLTIVGDPLTVAGYEKLSVGLGDITNVSEGSFIVGTKIHLPANANFAEGQQDITVDFIVEKTPKETASEDQTE